MLFKSCTIPNTLLLYNVSSCVNLSFVNESAINLLVSTIHICRGKQNTTAKYAFHIVLTIV